MLNEREQKTEEEKAMEKWRKVASGLNKKGIERGLMLPEGESGRRDFNRNLGKPLTQDQEHAYRAMSGEIPVSLKEINDRVSPGKKYETDGDRKRLWNLIKRMRKKLGTMAIVTQRGKGTYFSRRKHIEDNFPRRKNP